MNTTMNPPQAESITLYYREGSSDKVYQCSLEPVGDLFAVNVAYGRRGAAMQTGTKTSSPVDYESARAVYDKLIREKTAKGYTPGETGVPYQQSSNERRSTGIVPQLLNPIEEAEAMQLLGDPAWCVQEKMDGRRVLIRKSGNKVEGINRKGLLIGLPLSIVEEIAELSGDPILDGEWVGEQFHAFDILEFSGADLRNSPYSDRWEHIHAAFAGNDFEHLQLVEHETSATRKARLFNMLQQERREGVVFKRLDAPYTPGRPNSGGTQLKYKFCATLSAVVSKLNAQRSVELRLLNELGWVPVGNVTIPANQPVPTTGAVVEVRYLYAFPESNALFQPVYLGQRNDTEAHDCVTSQLKFKPAEEEP